MTTVKIGDREFRIGATYAPKRGGGRNRILKVVWTDPAEVEWKRPTTGAWGFCSHSAWLRWAGDEVKP